MFAQQLIKTLIATISSGVKDEKVLLLFFYGEGHPIRNFLIQKIKAEEKTLRGLEAMLHGDSALLAVEGLKETVVAVEEMIPRLPSDAGEFCHRERVALLALQQKLSQLEELMARPEDKLIDLPIPEAHGSRMN